MTRACTFGVTTGAGEYAPMPPVFGPTSPSPRRLWSWLVASARTLRPSHRTMKLASSPARNSSMTTRLPAGAAPPSMVSTAACASARVAATTTPLPAARPSALTTIGGVAAVDVRVRRGGVVEDLVAGGRDRVALHEPLGERLRALELGGGAGRAEDAQAARAKDVDRAGGERRFRADDGEIDLLGQGEVGELGEVGDGDVADAAARPPCRRCRARRRRSAPAPTAPASRPARARARRRR